MTVCCVWVVLRRNLRPDARGAGDFLLKGKNGGANGRASKRMLQKSMKCFLCCISERRYARWSDADNRRNSHWMIPLRMKRFEALQTGQIAATTTVAGGIWRGCRRPIAVALLQRDNIRWNTKTKLQRATRRGPHTSRFIALGSERRVGDAKETMQIAPSAENALHDAAQRESAFTIADILCVWKGENPYCR
jgi:hypothetical protein